MPSLDHNTLMVTTGPQPPECMICLVQHYKSYCRQCDEYFLICNCRPHGHEGHRVYPMMHALAAEWRAWDAVDQAVRGIEASHGEHGVGRACTVCREFTPDPHFAYVHKQNCPIAPLALVHRDLTGWRSAKDVTLAIPDSRYPVMPYEDPAPIKARLELACRERDQAREDAAAHKRFLADKTRHLRLAEDENARLRTQVYDLTHRPQQINVAAGIRIEVSIGQPQLGWSRTIQCRNCQGYVRVDQDTPTFGHVSCPHCRNNLVQQVKAI